jgi:hypothetical protein
LPDVCRGFLQALYTTLCGGALQAVDNLSSGASPQDLLQAEDRDHLRRAEWCAKQRSDTALFFGGTRCTGAFAGLAGSCRNCCTACDNGAHAGNEASQTKRAERAEGLAELARDGLFKPYVWCEVLFDTPRTPHDGFTRCRLSLFAKWCDRTQRGGLTKAHSACGDPLGNLTEIVEEAGLLRGRRQLRGKFFHPRSTAFAALFGVTQCTLARRAAALSVSKLYKLF